MQGHVGSLRAFLSPQPEPRSVLVVEDDVLVRLMITDELRDRGFGVIEAANADEAVTLLQSQAPVDLVFTDVRMPGSMDGIGLAKLVSETRPELKVVVASGDLPADVCQTIDAFFRKPYDPNIVAKRIEDLLDAH